MEAKSPFIRKYFYGIILILLLILPYVILFFQSQEQTDNYTKEDGIIENLSAGFYFMACCVMVLMFWKSNSEQKIYLLKTRRNYFFLMLGLLFLFCFGEEISWGQRIFGFTSSDFWKTLNMQGETNVHNLIYFHGSDRQDIPKTGIELWSTGSRIFLLIWLSYCIFVPILNAYFTKARDFFTSIHFPIVPVWVGILFLLNHFISKGFEVLELFEKHAIIEVKEANFAFLFLVASITFYDYYKNGQIQTNLTASHISVT